MIPDHNVFDYLGARLSRSKLKLGRRPLCGTSVYLQHANYRNKTSKINCQNLQPEREHIPSMMAEYPVINHPKTSTLLSPESKTVLLTEEQLHSWSTGRSQSFDRPLLRVWDRCSGSQPDETGCMKSRAPLQRLNTVESRKTSLTTHLNHNDWTLTLYISFTISPAAIQDLATFRSQRKNRGV